MDSGGPWRAATTPDEAFAGASDLVFIGLDVARHPSDVGTGARPPPARRLPVGLLAQQRFTEPVELGDHLLRRRAYSLTSPFAQLLQLPRHLKLDVSGNLVLRQGSQLLLRLAYRGPQILRGEIGRASCRERV